MLWYCCVVLSLLNDCFQVESYYTLNGRNIEEICNRNGPVNDVYHRKVRYGFGRARREVEIDNEPVTFDKDSNIITMKILAKPNAARNSIGVTKKVERLGLRIAAPPERGKANKEMLKFLAKTLGIRKSALSITEGLKSTKKTVKVEAGTIPLKEVLEKLQIK